MTCIGDSLLEINYFKKGNLKKCLNIENVYKNGYSNYFKVTGKFRDRTMEDKLMYTSKL